MSQPSIPLPDRVEGEELKLIFHVKMPPCSEGADCTGKCNDCPDEYAVVAIPHGPAGLIVYCLYSSFRKNPEWVANGQTRHLIAHLLTENARLRDLANGAHSSLSSQVLIHQQRHEAQRSQPELPPAEETEAEFQAHYQSFFGKTPYLSGTVEQAGDVVEDAESERLTPGLIISCTKDALRDFPQNLLHKKIRITLEPAP